MLPKHQIRIRFLSSAIRLLLAGYRPIRVERQARVVYLVLSALRRRTS